MRSLARPGDGVSLAVTQGQDRSSFDTEPGLRSSRFLKQFLHSGSYNCCAVFVCRKHHITITSEINGRACTRHHLTAGRKKPALDTGEAESYNKDITCYFAKLKFSEIEGGANRENEQLY